MTASAAESRVACMNSSFLALIYAALASYLFHHLQLLWSEASCLHLKERCKPKPLALSHSQVRGGEGLLHSLLLEVQDDGHLMECDLGSCKWSTVTFSCSDPDLQSTFVKVIRELS